MIATIQHILKKIPTMTHVHHSLQNLLLRKGVMSQTLSTKEFFKIFLKKYAQKFLKQSLRNMHKFSYEHFFFLQDFVNESS